MNVFIIIFFHFSSNVSRYLNSIPYLYGTMVVLFTFLEGESR